MDIVRSLIFGAFTQRKKWADWSDMDGYCYKGFKEYTDKQI